MMIDKVRNELIQNVELKYKEFHAGIVPGKNDYLGVRIPVLREISKRIVLGNYNEIKKYIMTDSIYSEERMIKGLIIGYLKEGKEEIKSLLFEYAKQINSWAICDSVSTSLKIIKKNNEYFIDLIEWLLGSEEEYKIRFGIVLMLNHYVNEKYIDYVINKIDNKYLDCYYVNMAISWLICECYIKFKDKTMRVFDFDIDRKIINKAISKIHDSYRVTKEEKEYLKKYRRY